jgi:hypothetical protein
LLNIYIARSLIEYFAKEITNFSTEAQKILTMTKFNIQFEILKASRIRLSQLMHTLSLQELLTIPKGFNNNILWQIGHCISSQQRHMYMRSGIPVYISEEFMDNFKIGTSPSIWKTNPNVEEVKHLLMYTVDKLENDLKAEIFENYQSFSLPIGIQVNNHLEALQAAIYHEAEHSGIIFTYLKILRNN